MKKKLEADLMSIAHRVLQMKNKSDINQLYVETRKLYEKLAVLQFVEEHFEGVKPTIGQAEVVAKMKQFFEETHLSDIQPSKVQDETAVVPIVENGIMAEEIILEEVILEEEVIVVVDEESISEATEEIISVEVVVPPAFEMDLEDEEVAIETAPSEIEKAVVRPPVFELDLETKETEEVAVSVENESKKAQISIMDLLGSDYIEPMFVKLDYSEPTPPPIAFESIKEENAKVEVLVPEYKEPKSVSLNDKLSKGVTVGLNDRIAFVKHLFGNSNEDYSRVMNQIITFNSYDEAKGFIDEMVKPDYNYWEGKEDYEQRFVEFLEKKFA